MNRKKIVTIVRDRDGIGPWWQQMVTAAYEQARGLRAKHQKPERFQITRTATLSAPISKSFTAWKNENGRSRWLQEPGLVIRKATLTKTIRMIWKDGKTGVQVGFDPKGDGKTQVTARHSKLPNAREAERMKAYRGEKLEQLRATLGA